MILLSKKRFVQLNVAANSYEKQCPKRALTNDFASSFDCCRCVSWKAKGALRSLVGVKKGHLERQGSRVTVAASYWP